MFGSPRDIIYPLDGSHLHDDHRQGLDENRVLESAVGVEPGHVRDVPNEEENDGLSEACHGLADVSEESAR